MAKVEVRACGASSSIAVLPFANTRTRAATRRTKSFTDGLTEELIGAISRVPQMTVKGRTAAFALKERGLEVRTIAELFGVTTAAGGERPPGRREAQSGHPARERIFRWRAVGRATAERLATSCCWC
jgi:TolB-like protein